MPGALTRNEGLHFYCEDIYLTVENNTTAWTNTFASGQRITMVPGEQQHAVIEVHDSQGQAYVDPELRVTINGQAPSTRPDASGTWTVPLHPTTAGDSVLRAWVGDYLSQEVVIPVRPAPPTGQEQEPPEPPAAGSSSTDWRVILLVAAGLGGIVSLILRALGGQR